MGWISPTHEKRFIRVQFLSGRGLDRKASMNRRQTSERAKPINTWVLCQQDVLELDFIIDTHSAEKLLEDLHLAE